MGASAIREILKVAARPDIVSLAGGLPAAEAFPMDIMADLAGSVVEKYGAAAFQYDRTEGFGPLRQALAAHLYESKGLCADEEAVLVSSGSQGVLDALGKVLISPGDRVGVEAPTYLGAIQAFNPYEPKYVSLETDDDGLIPESLEDALAQGPVKLVYLVPTFGNPTGRTLSLARRRRLAQIAEDKELLIVEDDPYGDLRYAGSSLPPIRLFAPERTVYIGTLSKVFAPGLRIGYCLAPESLRRWLVLAKQGVDLHTGTFSQALAADYIAGDYLRRHLPKILDFYRPRLAAMLESLAGGLPRAFRWSKPEGGMFVWLEGPEPLNMDRVCQAALDRGVAAVPGRYFFTDPGRGRNTMRLNFTNADPDELRQAAALLCEVLLQEASGIGIQANRECLTA
jgi:2-aminoadipate transaminase